jgi:putative transcriptional regulator
MSHDVFIELLKSARELRQQRVRRLTRLARAVGGHPRPRSANDIDVRAIRAVTGLSQSKFAELLSIEVSTLRNWEQGRRDPTGPARALLRAIRNDPVAVMRALTN